MEALEAQMRGIGFSLPVADREPMLNGIMATAYDHAGLADLPAKLQYMVFGLVSEQMHKALDGKELQDIIALGRTAPPIAYNMPDLPGFSPLADFRALELARPDVARELLRRGLGLYLQETCDETLLDRLALIGFPPDYAERPGSIADTAASGAYAPLEQVVRPSIPGTTPREVALAAPVMTFETGQNDFNQPVHLPRVRSIVRFGRDYFRAAAADIVRGNLPASSCEEEYTDHGDYFQTVAGNRIRIGNTITMQKNECGRIDLLVGSKGYKIPLFKTTSSQDVEITARFDALAPSLTLDVAARDEKLGQVLDETVTLDARGQGFSPASLPQDVGIDWTQMTSDAEFVETQAGGQKVLDLRLTASAPRPLNTYEACVAAQDMAERLPVTPGMGLFEIVLVNHAIPPRF